MELAFEPVIAAAAPGLEVILVEADVCNGETDDRLWAEIESEARRVHANVAMEAVNKRPSIAATRAAYKACGKDPNRYRPSSEAMMRRMVKGLGLYRTLSVIDLINLLSVMTGHSIGGFDADRIDGDTLTLGIGREGEPYEAIGRGELNIAGLPVFRDRTGGVGTPTSDNDRTKMTASTRRLVMTINMYGTEMPIAEIEAITRRLLETYANGSNIKITHYKACEHTAK